MTFTPANTVAIRSIRFHKWQLGSSVLFLVVLWGTSFPTSQIALRYCPPALFAGLRFALNSVAIGTVALFWREKPQWRTTWWIVCLSTILNVGTLVASTIAIHYLEAGLASLLVYIEPPLAALVAWAYLREKPTTLQAVAIVVGFAGIVVLRLHRRAFTESIDYWSHTWLSGRHSLVPGNGLYQEVRLVNTERVPHQRTIRPRCSCDALRRVVLRALDISSNYTRVHRSTHLFCDRYGRRMAHLALPSRQWIGRSYLNVRFPRTGDRGRDRSRVSR